MYHLTDFGKNGSINPRTGYPARPPTTSYNDKYNYDFYDNFVIRHGIGSEYYVNNSYYFKPRVLGKGNVRRIEQLYMKCKALYENERNLLSKSLGFDKWTEVDGRDWSVKNICNNWEKVFLNEEQIQITKMISSYQNRMSILWLCLKFALETEFVSKYGYDIDKKNREKDFSSEEKRITYTINDRQYSFLSSLKQDPVFQNWVVQFERINFQVIEEEI